MNIEQMVNGLRRPETQSALRLRSALKHAIGVSLRSNDFVEFDTPVLGPQFAEYEAGHISAMMPDGVVGWLAQSPQIYKQSLIGAGFERYYQFAHCFRYEPEAKVRNDCLFEFVQMDMEMRTDSAAEIRAVFEDVAFAALSTLDLKPPRTIPVLDAVECVEKFGTDRPDLRSDTSEMALVWVVNFPLFDQLQDSGVSLARHPMARPSNWGADSKDVRTDSFDLVLNGYEIASGDIRISDPELQREVLTAARLDLADYSALLTLLESGCPAHGGLGMGLDRLVMQLFGAGHVRDVSPFGLDLVADKR